MRHWQITWTLPARAAMLPVALAAAYACYPLCLNGPVLCVWSRFFGIACPGCGLTRAMCFLARGQFAQALELNALALPAAAFIAFLSLEAMVRMAIALRTRQSGVAGEAS